MEKISEFMATGDIIAFYYGNKVLIKRYIAGPGSWVDIQHPDAVTRPERIHPIQPSVPEGLYKSTNLMREIW